MAEYRKQHYVPQCYLSQFSYLDSKNKRRIYGIEKKKGNIFSVSIENAAEKHCLYRVDNEPSTISPPNDDPLFYEKMFSSLVESKIPAIIRQINMLHTMTVQDKEVISDELKNDLALFLVIQLMRTPKTLNIINQQMLPKCVEMNRELMKQLKSIKGIPNIEDLITKAESDFVYERFIKSVALSMTSDSELLKVDIDLLINNRSWVIYANGLYKDIPFVISDNPVVLYNYENKDMGYGTRNGIEVSNTVIFMPITPRYMLALYHKESVMGRYSELFQNTIQSIDEEKFIMTMNRIHFLQCERFCYSNNKTLLEHLT